MNVLCTHRISTYLMGLVAIKGFGEWTRWQSACLRSLQSLSQGSVPQLDRWPLLDIWPLLDTLTAGSTASTWCFVRACFHCAATLSSALPPGWLGNSPRARQSQPQREGLSASNLKKQSSVGWSSQSPHGKGPFVLSRQVAIPGV